MELIGIAIVAAGLMGAWHVTKYAVPRTLRAIGNRRRESINEWKGSHPGSPAVVRWAAWSARTFGALRWGPGFLKSETVRAWREGVEAARERFGTPVDQETDRERVDDYCPVCDGEGVVDGQPCPRCRERQDDPNDTRNCPVCDGEVVVDGEICPRCRERQEERNRQYEEQGQSVPPPEPPRDRPRTRPHLWPVPDTTEETKENTMPIDTATGGEIVHAEQFLAEAKCLVREAVAELEDAKADAARAEEDHGRVELMISSLTKVTALAHDISAVTALRDPAAQRSAAAKDRVAAADKRVAAARKVEEAAAFHAQLIGKAAGPFYNAA